jgi:hypothetical protein
MYVLKELVPTGCAFYPLDAAPPLEWLASRIGQIYAQRRQSTMYTTTTTTFTPYIHINMRWA